MGRPAIDLNGKTFERLTVIGRTDSPSGAGKHARWACRCVCGRESVVTSSALVNGLVKSCGCYARDLIIKSRKTHGMTNESIFRIWSGMLGRCSNSSLKEYPRYGGRGITVCDRWKTFANFYEDMGDRPLGKTLDRIDNNGNYEPKNCRWASRKEQAKNRSSTVYLTHRGESLMIGEWAERLKINRHTIATRLNRGWEIDRALSPVRE